MPLTSCGSQSTTTPTVCTLDTEKVWQAFFDMQGIAQQWYYRLERNQGTLTWTRFMELANVHFGPPTHTNPLG
jgi:hypothetical protein